VVDGGWPSLILRDRPSPNAKVEIAQPLQLSTFGLAAVRRLAYEAADAGRSA